MNGLELTALAKELIENGYIVYGWKNKMYNRSWYPEDFTSLIVATKENNGKILSLRHGDFFGCKYGIDYIKEREFGSGCKVGESSDFSVELVEKYINGPIPSWVKVNDKMPRRYMNIEECVNNFINKGLFHKLELNDEQFKLLEK